MGANLMEKLTYTNAIGESITFDKQAPFLLQKIDGTGASDIDDQSQKAPYQDGETPIDSLLGPRFPSIQFVLFGENEKEVFEKRRLVSRVFNSKLDVGTIRYEHASGVNEIKAKIDSGPSFPSGKENRGTTFQVGVITFKCHNPFWLDIESVSEPMTAYIGLFESPLEFPMEFGKQGSKQTFINDGDVETPVRIVFKGPATNPEVANNTTGEYFKLNYTLAEGESMVVDTTFGNKTIDIIKPDGTVVDGFNEIDFLNSTFWQLVPGENEIEYTAESGRDNAVVSITWRNRYIGI